MDTQERRRLEDRLENLRVELEGCKNGHEYAISEILHMGSHFDKLTMVLGNMLSTEAYPLIGVDRSLCISGLYLAIASIAMHEMEKEIKDLEGKLVNEDSDSSGEE